MALIVLGGFSSVGRKSISAKHNNHGGVGVVGSGPKEEITKTYTSSKKEELMKVINAAKQQLDNVSMGKEENGKSLLDAFVVIIMINLSFIIIWKVIFVISLSVLIISIRC